jgi:crotonobetainyl-CoA:carnitine CoA-transferase CaiB-like acyl-CoA transferase
MADSSLSGPADEQRPLLDGVVIVDLSRMLPGAILARLLLDLGARVIKVEEPGSGDPLRTVPPHVDGIGAAFSTLLQGAQSVCLDLRTPPDVDHAAALARHADVLVESFRPGVLDGWNLGWDRLHSINPDLVLCSLPSFGNAPAVRDLVAHDLNLQGMTGVLHLLGSESTVPAVQVADVGTGLLAATAILGALVARGRGGGGRHVVQPLASGVMPFVAWPWAEHAAGMPGMMTALLGGASPCYRVYRCGDGKPVAVAAVEPKFWIELLAVLGLPELADRAHANAPDSEAAAALVETAFGERPRREWLEIAARRGLPLSAVNDLEAARHDPVLVEAGLVQSTPTESGEMESTAGPFVPAGGRKEHAPAPRLGEHTEAILDELA